MYLLLRSVDETEEPEGDFIAVAGLDVGSDNVTVRKVGYLGEALFTATYLEDILLVNLQVTLRGMMDSMAVGHHGGEEGLAGGAFVGTGSKSMHEVGVVEEYLVGFSYCLESFAPGMELTDECCALEEGEEVDELVAGGGEAGAHIGDVGREGC